MFSLHMKAKRRRFQTPSFEERFQKNPFSWRISVKSNRWNKGCGFFFLISLVLSSVDVA